MYILYCLEQDKQPGNILALCQEFCQLVHWLVSLSEVNSLKQWNSMAQWCIWALTDSSVT